MHNEEIIDYLRKYESFGIAKIQRHFVWGYNRALAKIIELVDQGLIHEIKNTPFYFKVSDSNCEPPKQSFLTTIEDRSYDSYEFKEQLRIWFECTNDDAILNKKSRLNTLDCVKDILCKNKDRFINIINASKSNSLKLKFFDKHKEIKVLFNQQLFRKNRTSVAILLFEKQHSNINQFRRLLNKNNIRNYAIEKLYVVGDYNQLNQCKKFISHKHVLNSNNKERIYYKP